MEFETILILVWALIMTITLGILVVVLLNLKKKHDQDIVDKEDEIQEMNNKLDQKQSKSFQLGVNMTSGDYSEILGDFAILSKYDSIITLSTSSKKPSLDLIGINEESLDFLEIKKKGATISQNENHVRRLVEEKKVSYKVFDVELPDGFNIKERGLRKLKDNKKEIKEESNTPSRTWTNSDDEILKNYWNDESNKQSKSEKVQELCEKLNRSNGAINSRIKKLDLDHRF